MSRPVEFVDVQRRVTEFGSRASLVSVSADDRPHVVTAMIEPVGDRLVTRVGARTGANLADKPDLTLTWNPSGDGDYLLILDGTVESIGAADPDGVSKISIRIERGILHRLAGLPTTGANCISL